MNLLAKAATGDSRVRNVQAPDGGEWHWQPVPANGFIRNIFSARDFGSKYNYSIGTQTVDPGCFIREHIHGGNEELIFVLSGRAILRLNDTDYELTPGSAVFLEMGMKHKFTNPGPDPYTFLWIFVPGGLDDFFREIGRPRLPGTPAPKPFPRPANVAEIEARTVFTWADQNFDREEYVGKSEA